MALLGCVLIMYKAIWYDQFTCPDGFLLRVRLHRPGHRVGKASGQSAREGPAGSPCGRMGAPRLLSLSSGTSRGPQDVSRSCGDLKSLENKRI